MNFAHRVFGVFNILLAVFFASQIIWIRIQQATDTGSFIFWALWQSDAFWPALGIFSTRDESS